MLGGITTMNKLSRQAIFNKMQTENKTICEYCGEEKQGLSFVIGASKEPEWVLIEGTGKMCCPKCWEKARKEGQEVIKRL